MAQRRETAGPAKLRRYTVKLHQHGQEKPSELPVVAENREQATVEAARIWGVSWARHVCDMDVTGGEEAILRRLCPRCGAFIFERKEDYCPACRVAIRQDAENLKLRERRYYREQALRARRAAEEK